MILNKWLSPISSDITPLFNGIFIIPIILSVTLAFEGVTQEDSPLIVSTTYAESEPASEDKDVSIANLYQSYHLSLGITDYIPLPYSGLTTKGGSEDDGAGDNVYYGTGIFGAGNQSGHEENAALGYQALYSLTSGDNNTAMGYQALYSNTTGANNTASGYQALYSNTTGDASVATGLSISRSQLHWRIQYCYWLYRSLQ